MSFGSGQIRDQRVHTIFVNQKILGMAEAINAMLHATLFWQIATYPEKLILFRHYIYPTVISMTIAVMNAKYFDDRFDT